MNPKEKRSTREFQQTNQDERVHEALRMKSQSAYNLKLLIYSKIFFFTVEINTLIQQESIKLKYQKCR